MVGGVCYFLVTADSLGHQRLATDYICLITDFGVNLLQLYRKFLGLKLHMTLVQWATHSTNVLCKTA